MVLKANSKKNHSTIKFFKNLYRRIVYILFVFLVLLVAKILIYDRVLVEDFTNKQIESFSIKAGFIIKEISVSSTNEYCPIVTENTFNKYKNLSLLSISLKNIYDYTKSFDCIENVKISRIFPDKLKINIINKTPIAIWQNKKNFFFITTTNELMQIRNSENLLNFITFTGSNAYLHATKLIETISIDQEMFSQIDAAMRVGDRRWDIRLKDGTEIKLPENDPEVAWKKFIDLRNNSEKFNHGKMKTIDLRIEDKIYTN